jgi:hypothetical protein
VGGPNPRAHVKLVTQTLKARYLDKFVIVAELRQLKRVRPQWRLDDEWERPLEARGNLPPDHKSSSAGSEAAPRQSISRSFGGRMWLYIERPDAPRNHRLPPPSVTLRGIVGQLQAVARVVISLC